MLQRAGGTGVQGGLLVSLLTFLALPHFSHNGRSDLTLNMMKMTAWREGGRTEM